MTRTAVIAGASGLVGGLCLDMLLADETYGQVVALGRRRLELSHPKLEQEVVPFDQLPGHPVRRCDVAFCALGTTIRAAGSQAAFRKVDFDYGRRAPSWHARLSVAGDPRAGRKPLTAHFSRPGEPANITPNRGHSDLTPFSARHRAHRRPHTV